MTYNNAMDKDEFKEIENKILDSFSIDMGKFAKNVDTYGTVMLRMKQNKVIVIDIKDIFKQ